MTASSRHALALVILFCAPDLYARTWTKLDGGSINGTYQRTRGRTVLLDQGEETVRVPLAELSEADQQWIEEYREVIRTREWRHADGSTYQGRFEELDGDEVVLRHGRARHRVPLVDLTADDKRHLARLLEMTEAPQIPAELRQLDERSATIPAAGTATHGAPDGAEPARMWTDVRGRQIEASLMDVEGDAVVIYFKNREWRLPVEKLSYGDRKYVRDFLEREESPASALAANESSTSAEQPGGAQAAESQVELPPRDERPMAAVIATPADDEPASAPRDAPEPQAPPQELTANVAAPAAEEPDVDADGPPSTTEPNDLRPPGMPRWEDYGEDWERYDADYNAFVEAEYEKAFGDAERAGFAACENCDEGFEIPETFAEGDPCIYCQTPIVDILWTKDIENVLLGIGVGFYIVKWIIRLALLALVGFLVNKMFGAFGGS